MTKFAKPSRFDRAIAKNGVWFDIEDEMGNEWGSFKCRLVDPTLPHHRVAAEILQRRYNLNARREKVSKETDEKIAIDFLFEMVLVDWKLKDEKGKEIPFTRELVFEYFSMKEKDEVTGDDFPVTHFILLKLNELSKDPRNYQSDEQLEAGEPLKN